MSENLADRMRKAAGVPTAAEKQAEIDKRVASQAAWERDEPKRQAALEYYNGTINPIIHNAATMANNVAQEAPGFSILEARNFAPSTHVLARRSFQLQKLAQPNQALTNRLMSTHGSAALQVVGSLHFILSSDTMMHIDIPDNPKISIQNVANALPINSIKQSQIEDAFVRLLAKMNS